MFGFLNAYAYFWQTNTNNTTMEFNKKKNQLIWATGSQPITLLGILYFLVSSYEHEVIVSVIIFSVMLGIVFMSSLISAIRLLVIIKKIKEKISPLK